MNPVSIAVVTRFEEDIPSLRNILCTLESTDRPWDIQVHRLNRPAVPGENVLSAGIELGLLTAKTGLTALSLRKNADVVIFHKVLNHEIIEKLLGVKFSERLLLETSPSIYATVDADYDDDRIYIDKPGKSALLFINADRVYANSKAIAREAAKYTTEERIIYIQEGVDTEFFAPIPEIPTEFNAERFVLGWIGDADSHQADLQYLSTCLQEVDLSDCVLRLLLGGGSLSEETRRELERTGAELDIIEWVPYKRVPAVINSFDVGLAPLRDTGYNRGRGNQKVREYMACGVPVIGSTVGENPEMIPESAGILVQEPADWNDAVQTLRDGETRREMGTAARDYSEENYAFPVVAERLCKRIDSIL